ncbi:SusC/RagA family TonB-linked outer membrane protein [Paraflavisolibacter sp. H34]|uniref:SusC/RagA family TonB-linked outer membrane protein n=1 Tax=Huijunlia imazamoxiresistens TaxID=3127457 RepID=UPI003018150C
MRPLVYVMTCLLASLGAAAQQRTVSGKVSNNHGEPLPGTTVTEKGTKNATVTRADGTFTLNVAGESAVLSVSYTGYAPEEIPVGNQATISAQLVQEPKALNDVVVVGYGGMRKKDLTGAVASVSAKDFNKGAFSAPDQLIQGKVSGVQITNNSGAPGGQTTIRIRGNSSVRAGNNPLFVVDGVPLDGGTARPGFASNVLGNTPGGNPLNFINANDIASMEVLKDASAAAIYGSRGANGVVIISTKKGQAGPPQVDLSVSAGVSRIAKKLKVLNAARYRDGLRKYGLSSGDYGSDVDALDAITRTGRTRNYNASITGGNSDGRYRLSLGHIDQEGIVRKSGFAKYAANLSGSYKFGKSKKLGIDLGLLTAQTVENLAPISSGNGSEGSLIGAALQWNPTRPLRHPDGSLNTISGGSSDKNPLVLSEGFDDKAKTTDILASVAPSYKFTPHLEYKMQYSVHYGTGIRRTQLASYVNMAAMEKRGYAAYGNNELLTTQWTNTLNYNKKLSDRFSVNALLGYEYMKFVTQGVSVGALDFAGGDVPYTHYLQYSSVSSRSLTSFNDPESELQSAFGRLIGNYKDKLVVTATLRADGSSKFGANNKYGYFPSVAAAYNLGGLSFLQQAAISSLKFRAGWGRTGNQEFPAGAAKARYAFTGPGTIGLANLANPNLKWESSVQTNAGIDFGLFGERLSGSMDVYRKNTRDMLFNLEASLPGPSSRYWINLPGNIVNTGTEILLNGSVLRGGDFTWDLGVNAAFQQNRLTNYTGPFVNTGALNGPGLSGVTVQRIVNDKPLNIYYLKQFTGIDGNGQPLYGKDAAADYAGTPNPTKLLGFTTRLGYKKLSLEANMNGAFGHYLYNNTANAVLPIGNFGKRNVDASLMELPVPEALSSPLSASTRFLEKGDYLKLANATLSYKLGNIGSTFRNANLYLTGQNLFFLTKYKGFDPEVNTDKAVDGFTSFGIEDQPYPSARTLLIGFTTSF